MSNKKYHRLDGPIEQEMVDKLIAILNDESCKYHIIFFSSNGGGTNSAEVIVNIINNYNLNNRCLLVAGGRLFSAALSIVFSIDHGNVRYIPENLIGMAHLSCVEIEHDGKNNNPKNKMGLAQLDEMKYHFGKTIEFYKKIGLKAIEVNEVKRGGDVYLQAERMIELFAKNKIKLFNKV